jgi:hypothetical protein
MKSSYNGKAVPSEGKPIGYSGGELQVPEMPIIPFIEGDGTGRDIWKASRKRSTPLRSGCRATLWMRSGIFGWRLRGR